MCANRAFLAPFEPTRDASFFTSKGQRRLLSRAANDRDAGAAYAFAIVERSTDEIVGMIQLANVSHGAWENATLGYWVAESRGGRGYATEAVSQAVSFAFETLGLHRVQAGAMPRNARSIRVLEKNGFRPEGLAERYLMIDGRWEDHAMFAITAEEWTAGGGSVRTA